MLGFLSLTALGFPWWLRLTASILAGLVVVRMFVIFHDYQHGTILRGSRFAGAVMGAFGLLTLNPPSAWRRSHDHHHRNNSKLFGAAIGSYPIMTTATYAVAGRLERFRYKIARHPLTILLGYFTVFLYGMSLKPLLIKPREHLDSGVALAIQAAIIVLLSVFAPSVLIFTHLLPIMLAACLGAYLFYCQHNFPGVKFQERGEWDYVFAALNSSSFTRMNPVLHWFTGNIGYHHVHHLNARIPFYRLPEAMARIRELQRPRTTTLRPWDIYRCLRLKLWDTEKSRMVSYRGK